LVAPPFLIPFCVCRPFTIFFIYINILSSVWSRATRLAPFV